MNTKRFWRYFKAFFTGRIDDNKSPLEQAAFKGNVEAVRRLLDDGADIESGDMTPLHLAIYHGHTEVVQLLLERGARKDGPGTQIALAFAHKRRHADIIELMEKAGVKRDPSTPVV